ncbi:MAG TPA: hypothetical protein EYO06_04280 [Candidatus Marinimicrobia bacterium]|jgi:hypothetical protein|nr:hypothetical protein [Candidatus Neomarinimicrobiota bacterium]|tara:strand:- start:2857 stop:3435 length:579 start_codon:yes stop_codon:yes gene_type:complete
MHNPLIYIILLTAGLWPQSNPWKEKFISAMNDPRGVSITVEIEQKQFDTNSVERGTIEIVKKDHYLLDTSSETVVVMGDTIQTWNKQSNQLIIDQTIEGDFSIFNLLTGGFESVIFSKPIVREKQVSMHYDIPTMGYEGKIIIKKNGRPIELKIQYGSNQNVTMKVLTFYHGDLSLYHAFNPSDAEVIDLRE